jgi:hypothetical protein
LIAVESAPQRQVGKPLLLGTSGADVQALGAIGITDLVPFYEGDPLDVPAVFRWPKNFSNELIHRISRSSDTTYAFCSEIQFLPGKGPKKISFLMPLSNTRVPNNATMLTEEIFQVDARVVHRKYMPAANFSLVDVN